MKKQVRLYNVLFPVWFLLLIPTAWLIVVPANFVIDSAVLLIALKLLGHELKTGYKKAILKVWLFGFLSDIIGSILLLGATFLHPNEWWEKTISSAISFNPFSNFWAFGITLLCVAAAGLCIYLFNYKISFNKLDLTKGQRKKAALAFAVLTAPYLFFLPSSLLYS